MDVFQAVVEDLGHFRLFQNAAPTTVLVQVSALSIVS
jgi:hypothetical protein